MNDFHQYVCRRRKGHTEQAICLGFLSAFLHSFLSVHRALFSPSCPSPGNDQVRVAVLRAAEGRGQRAQPVRRERRLPRGAGGGTDVVPETVAAQNQSAQAARQERRVAHGPRVSTAGGQGSLAYKLTRSLAYSLAHSLTHSLTYSRTRSFTHSPTRSLTYHQPTHPLTHSITYSRTRSFTHSPTRSLTHSPTRSLTHSPSLAHSFTRTRLLIHSLAHSFTHSLAHSLAHLRVPL